MGGWTELVLAYAVFAASHFVPSLGGLRERLIVRMGRRGYFVAYGGVSLVLQGWMIVAAGRAPYVELWLPEPWTRWVPFSAMPVAVLLAAVGMGSRYPFTLGRRGEGFDPAVPGLARLGRHPLLLALGLWSGAHLVANGDVAHLLVFGGFAGMSLAAMVLCDRRAQAALPEAEVARLFRAAPILGLGALADGGWRRAEGRGLLRRLVLAGLVWGVLLALHPLVIGVSPWPVP
ncbi:NnrU family protein [Tabrizicola sp. BL-A-41-H6]|uniref:NnrU family protein n=1 Tax=Tabrizicola sp. BL-A-41-H6 TaxID=3421107 RepID=UPI003D676476